VWKVQEMLESFREKQVHRQVFFPRNFLLSAKIYFSIRHVKLSPPRPARPPPFLAFAGEPYPWFILFFFIFFSPSPKSFVSYGTSKDFGYEYKLGLLERDLNYLSNLEKKRKE
jgi:hypothetical protein